MTCAFGSFAPNVLDEPNSPDECVTTSTGAVRVISGVVQMNSVVTKTTEFTIDGLSTFGDIRSLQQNGCKGFINVDIHVSAEQVCTLLKQCIEAGLVEAFAVGRRNKAGDAVAWDADLQAE